jgi:hypothetical protein
MHKFSIISANTIFPPLNKFSTITIHDHLTTSMQIMQTEDRERKRSIRTATEQDSRTSLVLQVIVQVQVEGELFSDCNLLWSQVKQINKDKCELPIHTSL